MNEELWFHTQVILAHSLAAVMPGAAVARALADYTPRDGKTILVSVGKAAWQMAVAALGTLGSVDRGIVITKYGHSQGPLPNLLCREAGHPVPDENSYRATETALELVSGLTPEDNVIFLLSGGGSALFEKPLLPPGELEDITGQLLACGADIGEINTIRKRLSGVKGGRFVLACAPARVFSVVLSDVLGDRLDLIASGPACADATTCAQALAVVEKYRLRMSPEALALLGRETPKVLPHTETRITGSVSQLCAAAAEQCSRLGYQPLILTDRLCCQAREAGSFLASMVRTHSGSGRRLAFIAGGETVVQVTGTGKGGRNQELALAAAPGIAGIEGGAVFSFGSDGTDGPTDAAGGYVDGSTLGALEQAGLDPFALLRNNDAYHGLQAAGTLLITGPTGTNVNDVAVALVDG